MAEPDLRSPLLGVQPVEPPQLILTIREDSELPVHSDRTWDGGNGGSVSQFRNPFDFLGSEGFDVPETTTINPFLNDTSRIEGVYEWFKIVVCLPLALVRLVLFGFCLLLGYLATKLALEGWKDKENPMPNWRGRIMWITRICARCILFSFGYHWIRRKGKPAPRETAPIVVSNHVSYIEPIFYFYELFPTMVAAESHDSIPFVGTIIRAMQVIYVNRFSPSSRKRAVNEIKRKASCDRFPPVLLFPEGTTTNGRVLISFQLGAFIPGYPIQPVVVRYPHVHFDQSWGHISLAKIMFRMFTQFHNYMEVEYLPVVSPLDHKNESVFQFAKRTSHVLATALNVVQTLHTYGDLMLLMKASQEKQEKPSTFMVEMARMELLSCINSIEAVEFLDQFLCMNPDSSGRVNYENFLKVLHLKACPISEQIFAFIDVEKSGTVTFKQFLFSSVHVLSQPLFRVASELAFAELNLGGEDHISELELEVSMRLIIPDPNLYEVHELFELFDSDGDGEISKEDFCSCLRRNPLLIAVFSPCFIPKNRSGNGGDRLVEEIV